MIPPTTNEMKQHSDDLIYFAKDIQNFSGAGKALATAAVVVVALIAVMPFLPPMFATIV